MRQTSEVDGDRPSEVSLPQRETFVLEGNVARITRGEKSWIGGGRGGGGEWGTQKWGGSRGGGNFNQGAEMNNGGRGGGEWGLQSWGGSREGGNFNQGINRGGWRGGRGGGNDGRTPDIIRGGWGRGRGGGNLIRGGGQSGDMAGPGNSGRKCYSCNKEGHLSTSCPWGVKCFRCQELGHVVAHR